MEDSEHAQDDTDPLANLVRMKVGNSNLVIVPADDIFGAQSAWTYFKAVDSEETDALSLELDGSYQEILDSFSRRKEKVNYTMFPGFAYAMNLCINREIPLFASDPYQQAYFRKSELLSRSLTERLERDEDAAGIVSSLKELRNMRAQSVCKELRDLAVRGFKNITYLCSSEQASMTKRFIS